MKVDISGVVQSAVESIVGPIASVDQPLMEAGLDSLGAVELRNKLTAKFTMELPATLVFDYPSIFALAEFLSHSIRRGQQDAGLEVISYTESYSDSLISEVSQPSLEL